MCIFHCCSSLSSGNDLQILLRANPVQSATDVECGQPRVGTATPTLAHDAHQLGQRLGCPPLLPNAWPTAFHTNALEHVGRHWLPGHKLLVGDFVRQRMDSFAWGIRTPANLPNDQGKRVDVHLEVGGERVVVECAGQEFGGQVALECGFE